MRLLDPLTFGRATAPNRVMFGPHVTNLGDDDRRLTERTWRTTQRRAEGGCGTIVTEGRACTSATGRTSEHRSPARCRDGWAAIVDACRPHGALVIAVARPRRRPGLVGVQPAPAVGAVARARGQQARGAEVDGGRRHRRRRRRVRELPPGSPPRPGATVSRSTPVSTAWSASSSAGSPTSATTSGVAIGCCSPGR